MRIHYPILCFLTFWLFCSTLFAAETPNVILILADDLGYGDLGCYGAPDVKTPRLDRLADEGVRFTQFYANGTECTPTRTAIFTGRYPQRVGGLECAIGTGNVGRYDDAIRLAESRDLGLPPGEAVLARPLKDRGYSTAIFGKWHLGYEEKFLPVHFGFDEFFGFLGGYIDYFTHRELSELPVLYRDREPVEREGYMTHLIADEALGFLKHPKRKEAPFFLYLPFSAPHFPFQTPKDRDRKLTSENLTQGTREGYAAMIEDMDDRVGRILDELEAGELKEKTVVIFASDHGATGPGRNAPFRGRKGGLFEGGIRAPLIVRWPGTIRPGTISNQVTLSMDLTTSILRLTGATVPEGAKLDGIDILDHVAGGAKDVSRRVFWRARRGERIWWAARDGDMKYVARRENGVVNRWLFDLSADAAEIHDLHDSRPDEAKRMRELLESWERVIKPRR